MGYSKRQFFAEIRKINQKYDADIITIDTRDNQIAWCIAQIEAIDFDFAMEMRRKFGVYQYLCQNCNKDITDWVQNPSKGNLCPYCGEKFPDYEHRTIHISK